MSTEFDLRSDVAAIVQLVPAAAAVTVIKKRIVLATVETLVTFVPTSL